MGQILVEDVEYRLGLWIFNDPGPPVAVAWPLCSVAPGDPDCVGAP